MRKILVVQSSARQEGSLTREYTAQLVNQIQATNPGSWVVTRDLGAEPVPHLDGSLLGGWMKPAEEQSDAEKAAAARSDVLIDELLASDIVVIGSSMYNFGITSTLKSWFDHVLRAGRTFKYTENGPVGLAGERQVYVVTARGGRYSGTPLDFQEPYVRQLLGFIGIKDVEFINVEGQALGEDEAAKGRAEADEVLAAIA